MTAETLCADVVVVGGGPAGAATAWGLARNGVDVVVVDRARFPRAKPCAEYLSPQAARHLDEMGVLDALERSESSTLAGMRIFAPGGAAFEGRFAGEHGYRAFRQRGLTVRRERLDTMLLDAARRAGARVVEGAAVRDLLRDDAGAAAGVLARAGSTVLRVEARHVVGADGLRSVVSRRAGLARRFRWPRRYAFVTHYRSVDGLGDCGEMHVFADGYCGIADVGGGVTNFAVVVEGQAAAAAAGRPAEFLADWLARHGALAARFAAAIRVSNVAVTGPFGVRVRAAWAPGITLVGDAADFFDPFTGEGIYAALRGAELLIPYVAAALDARTSNDASRERAALRAYDRCRRHEFGGKWRLERLVALAVAYPSLMTLVARRFARRRDLADLLVGVTGDFIPASRVLNFRYALALLGASPGHA